MKTVHLTQQDFVSTFPWGIHGDEVRISQQETENALLDAETLSAMAYMLGAGSESKALDEAWKLLLNSQNHDVHVCLYDEVGIDWCKEAQKIALEIKNKVSDYIAEKVGVTSLSINTLSWERQGEKCNIIPAFGYLAFDNDKQNTVTKNKIITNEWFGFNRYSMRIIDDGRLELKLDNDDNMEILLGNLTVFCKGKTYDTAKEIKHEIDFINAVDGNILEVRISGMINNVSYIHEITACNDFIDFNTTFDYREASGFGPEISDFEDSPRRTHYFQHEKKLCMNFEISDKNAEIIYNSPFLTWKAPDVKSIESLHFTAIESKEFGLAHMNIGQSGYAFDRNEASGRHVLAFAPGRYVYDGHSKTVLSGKQTHKYRFIPYKGDWRNIKLPLVAFEFQRSCISKNTSVKSADLPPKAGFIGIESNSTIASAMFERNGRLFLRLFEWSGQEDEVSVSFGKNDVPFVECEHSLIGVKEISRSFKMQPWEIKTIELKGDFRLLTEGYECSKAAKFQSMPSGWSNKSLFEKPLINENNNNKDLKEQYLYFASGYHDGFVRPLEHHSATMEIEMERVHMDKYPGYASSWEIGGSCWVQIKKNEPEYIEKLKSYLKEGTIEIVGGTWSEPLSLIVSGESNIRQFFYGMESMKENLDYQIKIYMNQEHAAFAQIPQILMSFGIKAVVNRTQWAPFGYESGFDEEIAEWIGVDGTKIILIPRYETMDYNTYPGDGRNLQNGSITGHNRIWRTLEKFQVMRDNAVKHGIEKPLMTMLEDIWEPELRTSDTEMDFYASVPFVKFTSISRYIDLFKFSF